MVRSGMRAGKASATLEEMGYENLNLYSGSFEDWVSNNGKIEK